jgi:arylformamidase
MILRIGVAAMLGAAILAGFWHQGSGTADNLSLRERLKEKFAGSEEKSLMGLLGSQRDNATVLKSMVAQADVSYGTDPLEKFDVYTPENKVVSGAGLPVLVMVHGGGWKRGDKASGSALPNKLNYFLPRGYTVISVNYPVADSNPEIEVNSVGKAVSYIQKNAESLGVDAGRVVLMGHSAGAHLVALLTADDEVRLSTGVEPWLGTIALDSAAFDVPSVMNRKHYALYDDAFGTDTAFWEQMSPYHQYESAQEPMLLVCSATRPDGACDMAEAFKDKIVSVGGSAEVLPENYNHALINSEVGVAVDYTAKIQAFLTGLSLP